MNQIESIEISATTVEEAIELALEHLDRGRDEVDVEVLRYPDEPDEHGFTSDEALVLVTTRTVTPSRPPASVEQRTSSRRSLSPGERMRVSQAGYEVLSDLLHHLGLVASCRVNNASVNREGDEPVVLEVEGEDLGVLIGRRGEHLDALEYMLNVIVQKQAGIWPYLRVDVAGYRQRREETLENLARRMARRVAQTQQPYTFEPMSARERRVIHMAVQDNDQVVTESAGEGEERRVVIYPAR